jgi:hypothetical protein
LKQSHSTRTKRKAIANIQQSCSDSPAIANPTDGVFGTDSLGADSEEKHEPVSDIDTAVVDSLKALDPERPIREATKFCDASK